MITRPSATDGDAVNGAPASNSQSVLPEARSRTYSLPSLDPTMTRAPTMAGEDSTRARVGKDQRCVPVAMSRARMFLSRPPSTIVPPLPLTARAAEE